MAQSCRVPDGYGKTEMEATLLPVDEAESSSAVELSPETEVGSWASVASNSSY